MLQRGLLCRWLSSASGLRRIKGFNLTPYVSPLLFRLHPDTMQRQAPALAQKNEQALKQLNVFLELASFGCNNDAFNARKHILARTASCQDLSDAPVRFPLMFYVQVDELKSQENVDGLAQVNYTVEVPGRLIKRTLSNPGRLTNIRDDPEAAIQAPFAREWQRTTKQILKDLFLVAQVPFHVEEGNTKKMTALAEWLAEEETLADQAIKHGIHVNKENQAKKRELEQFDSRFYKKLSREKDIVQEITTGLEDIPTTHHAVLTSLLRTRLFLPKFQDLEMRKSAFHWIANFLLVNFMELRLHSLVWNKITLFLSANSMEQPQVSWDENSPELGMGFLFPLGMDVDALIDFIYSNVQNLEFSLEQKSFRAEVAIKEQQKLMRERKKPNRRSKRRKHFYQDEVDAIFGCY
ncbi:hypothetical protein Plhal304r1_c029g0094931 [Plasmopara halstedii]